MFIYHLHGDISYFLTIYLSPYPRKHLSDKWMIKAKGCVNEEMETNTVRLTAPVGIKVAVEIDAGAVAAKRSRWHVLPPQTRLRVKKREQSVTSAGSTPSINLADHEMATQTYFSAALDRSFSDHLILKIRWFSTWVTLSTWNQFIPWLNRVSLIELHSCVSCSSVAREPELRATLQKKLD